MSGPIMMIPTLAAYMWKPSRASNKFAIPARYKNVRVFVNGEQYDCTLRPVKINGKWHNGFILPCIPSKKTSVVAFGEVGKIDPFFVLGVT